MCKKGVLVFGLWFFVALTVSGPLMAQEDSISDPVMVSETISTATEDDVKPETAPPDAGSVVSVSIPGTNVTFEMVWIPAGGFLMGSPETEEGRFSDEGPQRQVTIRGVWMGKTEVTQAQWEAVMGSNWSHFKGPNHPVEFVSWNDCQEFIRKLNEKVPGGGFRLPSEAEWEYACRAGSTTRYHFGDSESELGNYAWFDSNSNMRTNPVGQKIPNVWGLYDMHGNVQEWCGDDYIESDNGSPDDRPETREIIVDDTSGTDGRQTWGTRSSVIVGSKWKIRNGMLIMDNEGVDDQVISERVLRGGCWFSNATSCRSAARRIRYKPESLTNYSGVRLSRTP